MKNLILMLFLFGCQNSSLQDEALTWAIQRDADIHYLAKKLDLKVEGWGCQVEGSSVNMDTGEEEVPGMCNVSTNKGLYWFYCNESVCYNARKQ